MRRAALVSNSIFRNNIFIYIISLFMKINKILYVKVLSYSLNICIYVQISNINSCYTNILYLKLTVLFELLTIFFCFI